GIVEGCPIAAAEQGGYRIGDDAPLRMDGTNQESLAIAIRLLEREIKSDRNGDESHGKQDQRPGQRSTNIAEGACHPGGLPRLSSRRAGTSSLWPRRSARRFARRFAQRSGPRRRDDDPWI